MRGQIKEKGGRHYDFRLHKHPVAGVRFCQLANDLEIGRAIPVVSGPSHITVRYDGFEVRRAMQGRFGYKKVFEYLRRH
jgi:hypothetical protein